MSFSSISDKKSEFGKFSESKFAECNPPIYSANSKILPILILTNNC